MTGTGPTGIDDEYAALYREHNARLVAYARSLTGSAAVAEDLAAEAHFRVWRRISAGHTVDNPSAYLTTTVRNLAAGLGRAQREIARDAAELPEDPERAETLAADPERRASHVDLISRLLKELPERWAKALWYAEVEDLPMEAVGERIGASAGTTAVVLTRARERLRQAFLQSQPGRPANEECEQYWKQMPTIVRSTASARRSKHVLDHCDGCEDCRGRLLALTEENTRLPLLLGPALLGLVLGGGAWFLPTVAGVGAGAVGAGVGAGTVGTEAAGATGTGTAARTGSRAASGARHARVGAKARLAKHGVSPAKATVYGSVAAVGVAVAATAIALASTTSPSHTNAAASSQTRVTAQPTAAAASGTKGSAAATPPAAKQSMTAGAPTSAAPGTTSPASSSSSSSSAADEVANAQQATQAAVAPSSTNTSSATTTGPATAPGTPATSTSSTATPSTAPTSSTPTATPPAAQTPTPTPSQTISSPTQSPTPPCVLSINGFCVIP